METSTEWIFDTKFLEHSATREDGGSESFEKKCRLKTVWFMEDLGKDLKCTRDIVSTASVYFHRFYAFHSFNNKLFQRFEIGAACLFLASKVNEWPMKLKDVITKYLTLRLPKQTFSETDFKEAHRKILVAERMLLNTLCFDVNVTLPKSYLSLKIKDMKNFIPTELRQDFNSTAITILNDSFRTDACLRYTVKEIALAVIHLTAAKLDLRPLTGGLQYRSELTWFDVLDKDSDDETIKKACATILDLYTTDGMQKYSLTKEALQSMRKQVEASQNVNENRMVVDSLKSSLALTKGNIREHNYSEESKNHTQNDLRNDNASVRGIAHLERHFSKTEDIAPSAQSTPSVLPPPSPANSVLAGDTPLYMPPPPDTPFEERASSSTPTFDFPTPAYNDLKSASRDDWDDRLMAKKQRII